MTSAIPVIDIADYLAGRPGALQATARALRDALTTVGFLVITGHDVPPSLIAQTFGEAKRLHDLPMASKLALRLNEHNNGYMAMGRYAVWTSDVNRNDKPDLNEAFFIKRERAPDDPLRRSGRRFVGANVWPDEAELPGLRRRALDYADTMDGFARRMLPAVAVALDLPTDWFDEAFRQSQFSFRLSHYPPVAAANQFGIAPHTDSNFMTFLAQTDVRAAGAYAIRHLARRAVHTGLVRGEFRGHVAPMDQWPLQVHAASRAAAGWSAPLRHSVLPRPAVRLGDRVPADLHRPG